MRQVLTVRARTTALATCVSGVALVAAAVALVWVLDGQLTRAGDGAALARTADLRRELSRGDLPRTLAPETDDGVVQVVAADGTVLGASPNIAGRPALTSPADAPRPPRVATVRGPDDAESEEYRLWRSAVATPDGVVTVQVGTSLESVREATRRLRTALLLGLPALLAALGGVVWWVTGLALGRVEAVRRQVDAISADDLTQRVDAGPDDEVGRLVVTTNRLLDRLEEARRRQRTFVADASHELRSPLTAVRTQLEVARLHPGTADWPALSEALLEDCGRLERLVHDLLDLAAAESSEAPPPGSRPVDLADLARTAAANGTRVAADGVVVVLDADPSPTRGSPDDLARVARNLLDNAVRHASGRVRVSTRVEQDTAVLAVEDDGPGVAPADAADVFERFHRGDPARSGASRGTGLGLPIARALARRHGGDVVLTRAGPGACFELRLPVARRDSWTS